MDTDGNCGDGGGDGGWSCDNENECSFKQNCDNICYEDQQTCESLAPQNCDVCSGVDCLNTTIDELYVCCLDTGVEQQTCMVNPSQELIDSGACEYIGCYDSTKCCCEYETFEALTLGENINCEDPQIEGLMCTNTWCCQPNGQGGFGCDIVNDVNQCCGNFEDNQFFSQTECEHDANCEELCGGGCDPGLFDCTLLGLPESGCVEENGGCCDNCNEGYITNCSENTCEFDNALSCCCGPQIPECNCMPGQGCPFEQLAECEEALLNCPQ